MSNNLDHLFFLQLALESAVAARGFCAPNPSVGALIVSKEGIVLSAGCHDGPGSPHAEIDALNKLTLIPSEATLYVTLEPCCHFGRTPPCTQAIIRSGIKRVVFGFYDPNPLVSGQGKAALLAAKIHCTYFPVNQIDLFYDSYKHWHLTKLPIVTAKIALTLDGKIAATGNTPIKITGSELNCFTHAQRKINDAILSTVTTIIQDDPQLNVRLKNKVYSKPLYILDSELNLPLDSQIFSSAKSITAFHAKTVSKKRLEEISAAGVRCFAVDSDSNGLDLQQILSQIGQDGIHDLWIEAGGKCFASFLERKLLNRAYIYIAPKILGSGKTAFNSKFDFAEQKITWRQVGDDVICEINW